jgi:hypothetical protein
MKKSVLLGKRYNNDVEVLDIELTEHTENGETFNTVDMDCYVLEYSVKDKLSDLKVAKAIMWNDMLPSQLRELGRKYGIGPFDYSKTFECFVQDSSVTIDDVYKDSTGGIVASINLNRDKIATYKKVGYFGCHDAEYDLIDQQSYEMINFIRDRYNRMRLPKLWETQLLNLPTMSESYLSNTLTTMVH